MQIFKIHTLAEINFKPTVENLLFDSVELNETDNIDALKISNNMFPLLAVLTESLLTELCPIEFIDMVLTLLVTKLKQTTYMYIQCKDLECVSL